MTLTGCGMIGGLGEPDSLSAADLRRGSVTLDLLLNGGMLGKAWRHYGLERAPRVVAPDVEEYIAREGHRLEMIIGLVAGGGRQKGMDIAFLGAFRVDNPSTGVPAEADKGFAVAVSVNARSALDAQPYDPEDKLQQRKWYLSEFLKSTGAVRLGKAMTRRAVIQYFRNYAGGAHHYILGGTKGSKRSQHELAADVDRAVHPDFRNGLHFELLSIGQAVARSDDVRALAELIRKEC